VTAVPPAFEAPRTTRVEASLYYDPSSDKGRRHGVASVALALGMVLGGSFLGLLTALLTFYQLGIGAALAGVVVAFLPAPSTSRSGFGWTDTIRARVDPRGGIRLGRGAATFMAGIVNSLFQATVMAVTRDQVVSEFLSASVSAPFTEELLKGIAVLAIFLLVRREFDGIVDGVLYSGVVALGLPRSRTSSTTARRWPRRAPRCSPSSSSCAACSALQPRRLHSMTGSAVGSPARRTGRRCAS